MQPRKVNIHLGAHKTATTYIQKTLLGNADKLSLAGIRYISMKDTRANITGKIGGNLARGPGRASAIRAIRKYASERFLPDDSILVFSDENIPGNCGQIYRKSDLYPDSGRRLGVLAEALRDCEVNVFFCIRDYVDFFPSAYCEYLRHNDFLTFGKFLGGMDLERDYWVRVLDNIVNVFGSEHTHAWCYGDFSRHRQEIMSSIISTEEVKLRYDSPAARPSMSDQSIRVLYKLDEFLAPAETRKMVNAVASSFPKGDEYAGYSPWSDELRARWTEKYSKEIDILQGRGSILMRFS